METFGNRLPTLFEYGTRRCCTRLGKVASARDSTADRLLRLATRLYVGLPCRLSTTALASRWGRTFTLPGSALGGRVSAHMETAARSGYELVARNFKISLERVLTPQLSKSKPFSCHPKPVYRKAAPVDFGRVQPHPPSPRAVPADLGS